MIICLDFIGLEAAITDYKGNPITLKNAKVVVESEEENKIQVRFEFLVIINNFILEESLPLKVCLVIANFLFYGNPT